MTEKPPDPGAAGTFEPPTGFAYYLDQLLGLPGLLVHKLQELAFLAWIVRVKLGLSRKEILVVNCNTGGEIDGFYAQFTLILGLLEHFENWRFAIAGVRVDLENKGLFYDASHGANSWEYYFQPVDVGRETMALERKLDLPLQLRCTRRGERMPRAKASELIARHIHVKPHIREKVDAFVRAHFEGVRVIGVHYRGTDKWMEAPRLPYAEVCAAVRNAIDAMDAGGYRLFVASDEQAFVDTMENAFPGRVLSWETRRSRDGKPIDLVMEDNYKKGEDAVIDCLLLSRCQQLIRTSSSLSLCSTYFNPDIPVVLLNREYWGPEAPSA